MFLLNFICQRAASLGVDVNVPLLVVGTKHDVAVAGSGSLPTHQGRSRATTGSVPKFSPVQSCKNTLDPTFILIDAETNK